MIIDANNLKVGRFATVAAKAALKGETVLVVNCENAVFTGNKRTTINKFKQRRARGNPHWGPHFPRMPDRLVRRLIKGMLPMDTARGREAYKLVMCHVGNPTGADAKTIPEADISNSQTLRFITVGELCRELGANYE